MEQITDLNDLRFFAEIAEHGNYTAAGHGLGIQPSKLNRFSQCANSGATSI